MLPHATIFAPSQWQRGEFFPLPGINYLEYSYFNGEDDWGCPADSFVGSAEQWERGPLTTDPVPEYNEESKCPVSCGCVPPSDNPVITTCENCPDGAWTYYLVTVEGAVGGAAEWNGTWLATYEAFCGWFSPGPNEDWGVMLEFSSFLDPPSKEVFLLFADADGDTSYFTGGFPNCVDGPWTVNFEAGNPDFPATVVVEKFES